MTKLNFYVTRTRLPLEKVRKVVTGYTIVENCTNHKSKNTIANPYLNHVQELIISNRQYPAALLRQWGYTSSKKSLFGFFPRRTIFFYKHHISEFENIKPEFKASLEGTEFVWSCGCKIRKFTKDELEELCSEPWYPFIGEREPAFFEYGKKWQEKMPTRTPEEIASVLKDAGLLTDEEVKIAASVIRSHRGN